MPTVLKEGPYRLFFYSNEGNEPPHIHVEYENSTAKFWLNPVELVRNHGIASHRLTKVQSLVQEHRTQLLEAWHEHFSE